VATSNAIFRKRMWYSDNTYLIGLIVEVHLVLMLWKFLLPLVSIISTILVNSKCLLGL
jgi:hypothetical protein